LSVVEKERKKAEKAKKFAEKQAKTTTAPAAAPSKTKEKKAKTDAAKDEPLPKYMEETPEGQKKSSIPQRLRT
jgi:valyl-tRNA synthetase